MSVDLHGNAPDDRAVALLLIDVINDLEFDEGDALLEHALPMARTVAALKGRCRALEIPVVYVNDNFGRWRSDFRAQVEHCLHDGVRGKKVVEMLVPEKEDYFVSKPKHSGFFASPLELLLRHLGAKRVILAGIAGDMCVLHTAHDADLRDFELFIPSDCVASRRAEDNHAALVHFERTLGADTRPSVQLDLERLCAD